MSYKKLINRHLREMLIEVFTPFVGKTTDLRMCANIADAASDFCDEVRAIAEELGKPSYDTAALSEDDFIADEMFSEFEADMAETKAEAAWKAVQELSK